MFIIFFLLFQLIQLTQSKENHVAIAINKLPEDLISRADDILTSLESNKVNTNTDVLKKVEVSNPKWVEEMKKVDPLSLSPLEALNFLYEIKRKMGDK